MPALETSINLEVKQIKSQEETWKTQLVNGGAADVSLNSLHRLNSSDNANEMKPDRLVETQTETTAVSASNCEKVVSNGQPVVITLRAESKAVQNDNSQTLTPNNCNTPTIVSKTPFSAALSFSTPKTAAAPVVMNAPIINGSTNVQSAEYNPVPKTLMNAGQTGTSSPVVVANNVVQLSSSVTCAGSQPTVTVASTCGQAKAEMSLAPTSQAAASTMTAPQASKVARVATITQTPGKGTVISLPRPSTPQSNGVPRTPQTTSVQLPANFQIPQGMVLIRSDSGQLMLVSQQALAQAQAQGIIPRVGTAARAAAAPGASQPTAVIRNSEVTPVIKVPPPPASSKPVTSFQKMTVLKASGGAVSSTVGHALRTNVPAVVTATAASVTPAKAEAPKATPTANISAETLENVKKCKNFLVTLIKLASGGTHSAEMAKNVKDLVKSLLDGKIEAEEFTGRLYTELKSSPQPYLVPFLKRSLPAVRQLTPNSQLFIQQCALPKPPPAPLQGAKPAPAVLPGSSRPAPPGLAAAQARRPAHTPGSTHLVIQQPRGAALRPSLASGPTLPLPVQGRALPKQFASAMQSASRATGTILSQSPVQVSKIITMQPSVVQRNCFKDGTPASFREEDDINDVASMAGVNLSEESARILATSSELVGSVIRSCRDEPFIPAAVLHKRLLETGRRHGITDVSPDAVSLLSHATQDRLRDLLEKLTAVARHRKVSFKDDARHVQSSDVRAQLKFLEQLDRLEKQRKDGEEREILLRVAKSRSNREDPEQLRLKQKAKEMQQLELAQMQQRDANLTALAAIGPRKKRPLDSRGAGSGSEVTGAVGSGVLKQGSVQRITRVGLKDLLFCMEQDPALRHTLGLYRALLR